MDTQPSPSAQDDASPAAVTPSRMDTAPHDDDSQRWQLLAQASGQIIWTLSQDARQTDFSAWRAYTGQFVDGSNRWSWVETIHPDDREYARTRWEQALAEGYLGAVEYRIRRADGVYRMFSITAVSMVTASGAREWVGACIDVTERMQAQAEREQVIAEAQRRARRLEAIIAAVPDRISIFDAQGTLVQLNPAAQRVAGPARGGETIDQIPTAYTLRTLDGAPIQVEDLPLTRALRGEYVHGVEMRHVLADGREALLMSSAAPIVDPEGNVEGVVALAHDVTGLRHAERESAARASQVEAVLDAINDAVLVYDTQATLVRMNRASYELFRIGDSQPDPAQAAMPYEERVAQSQALDMQGRPIDPTRQGILAVLAGTPLTSHDNIDVQLRRGDGTWGIFTLTGQPIRTEAGEIVGAVMVCRDVTERRRLEDETKALALELETILEASTDGIALYDAAGNIVRLNAAARRLFGYDTETPAHPMANPASERFAPLGLFDDQGRPFTEETWPLTRLLQGETLFGSTAVDMQRTSPEGATITINVQGTQLRDATGAITGVVAVTRDVTERRRLELRTREALMALVAMAEALVAVDEEDEEQESPPSDMDAADALAEVANKPTIVAPAASSGTRTVAERLLDLTCRMLGCERGAIVTFAPDTEYLQLLAAVGLTPEREAFWRTQTPQTRLQDALGIDLATRLRAGEVLALDANQTQVAHLLTSFGVRSVLVLPMRYGETLIGALALDYGLVDHHYTADEVALAGAAAQLGTLVVLRQRLLREREEARASAIALAESNRRMDAFLSIASHELKTPLTTIKANLQLGERNTQRLVALLGASGEAQTPEHSAHVPKDTAANKLRRADAAPTTTGSQPLASADGDEVRARIEHLARSLAQFLTRARTSADRQERLVNDLLDVSRIREGKLELDPMPFDLDALARECVQEQRMGHPTRRIQVVLPEVPTTVFADADRVRQVITNFLTNALKYSAAELPVRVEVLVGPALAELGIPTEAARTMAALAVHDEGVGIPAEEQQHVWDIFHRVPGIDVQSGSGIGLGVGLHISKTMIDRQGGTVGVLSAPGAGSTFWFTLPLAPAE